jgi:polysaccharide deacetylase 2 family uncharacterized protein YibQ
MVASTEETAAQAQEVSAAAEQISRRVDTVSSGSKQLGASIRDFLQNVTEAAQVAGEAVGLAATTSATMNRLGESSAEIGRVVTAVPARRLLILLIYDRSPARRWPWSVTCADREEGVVAWMVISRC